MPGSGSVKVLTVCVMFVKLKLQLMRKLEREPRSSRKLGAEADDEPSLNFNSLPFISSDSQCESQRIKLIDVSRAVADMARLSLMKLGYELPAVMVIFFETFWLGIMLSLGIWTRLIASWYHSCGINSHSSPLHHLTPHRAAWGI